MIKLDSSSVKVRTLSLKKGKIAQGIEASWGGPHPGQWVAITCARGMIGCGAFDVELMEEHEQVIAVAHGSAEDHLITCEDLLNATITGVTKLAKELGVKEGMTAMDAAVLLS